MRRVISSTIRSRKRLVDPTAPTVSPEPAQGFYATVSWLSRTLDRLSPGRRLLLEQLRLSSVELLDVAS